MLNFTGISIANKYNRMWLARHWGFKGFQAIAKGVFCPRGGGQIILFATHEKRAGEENYKNYIRNGQLHWNGEKGHRSDERIANAKRNGEDIHLFYRDLHRDDFEYFGLLKLLVSKPLTHGPSEFVFKIVGEAKARNL